MIAEGWYKDPYNIHEARWFSDGRPTSLVRDGRESSTDPAPSWDYDDEPLALGDPNQTRVPVARGRLGRVADKARDVVDVVLAIFPW